MSFSSTQAYIRIRIINGVLYYETVSPELPPPPSPMARQWWEILGVDMMCRDKDEIRRAYKAKAKEYHPDAPGGQHERMAELNAAYDVAKKLI